MIHLELSFVERYNWMPKTVKPLYAALLIRCCVVHDNNMAMSRGSLNFIHSSCDFLNDSLTWQFNKLFDLWSDTFKTLTKLPPRHTKHYLFAHTNDPWMAWWYLSAIRPTCQLCIWAHHLDRLCQFWVRQQELRMWKLCNVDCPVTRASMPIL